VFLFAGPQCEFHQRAVANRFDNQSAMLRNPRINEPFSWSFELGRVLSSLLRHQSAAACNVRRRLGERAPILVLQGDSSMFRTRFGRQPSWQMRN
jgi:hypothetical protein